MENIKVLILEEDLEQHKAFVRVYKDYDEIKYKLETADVTVDLTKAGCNIDLKQASYLAECLDIPLFMDI